MSVVPEGRIDRSTIEAKLRELRGEVDTTASAAKPVALTVGVVAVVAAVGIAYGLGRRKGRKRATVVEIRRV